MNPPFAEKSLSFMRRALGRSTRGVAAFVRTTQLDGHGRYRHVYRGRRPAIVAQFVERVPLHKGRWIPNGRTFTAYCWIVWRLDRPVTRTDLVWIPPCREQLLFQRDLDHLPWSTDEDPEAAMERGDR
jgi:hypothetical protein